MRNKVYEGRIDILPFIFYIVIQNDCYNCFLLIRQLREMKQIGGLTGANNGPSAEIQLDLPENPVGFRSKPNCLSRQI